MKRTFFGLLVLLIMSTILGLAGCDMLNPNVEVEQLETPTNLRIIEERRTLAWDAVENGKYYRVTGEDYYTMTEVPEIVLHWLTPLQTHAVKVQATYNSDEYADSEWSEEIEYTPPAFLHLDAPTGLTVDYETNILSWGAVENAVSYEIVLHYFIRDEEIPEGLYHGRTTETSISLEEINAPLGHPVSVRAVGDKIDYKYSEYTTCDYYIIADLEYELINNNTEYEVINASLQDAIVVPSEHNGLPVTSIKDRIFQKRTGLRNVHIGKNVVRIGEQTFAGSYIETITFAEDSKLTTIGNSAFQGCSMLSSVTLPSLLTTIEERAFASCESLYKLVIPLSVQTIGVSAFDYCNDLIFYVEAESAQSGWHEEWNIGNRPVVFSCKTNSIANNQVEYIELGGAVYGLIDDYAIVVYTSRYKPCTIVDTVLRDGKSYPIKVIGDNAFYNRLFVTEIVLPDTVEHIGNNAFGYCCALTSITLPSGLKSIGNQAFFDCNITGIELPESLTSIGDDAFFLCNQLTSVFIPISVTNVGSQAFQACEQLTIYVEADSKPDGWHSDWNAANCPVVWGAEM